MASEKPNIPLSLHPVICEQLDRLCDVEAMLESLRLPTLDTHDVGRRMVDKALIDLRLVFQALEKV